MRPALPIALAVLLSSSACTAVRPATCGSGEHPAVQDTLYFGAAKSDGVVTDEAWTRFLKESVTPRFPKGFTVTDAAGQWLSARGDLEHESSRVLVLVHPQDAAADARIADIIARYEKAFQQESVMRTTAPTCVSF